MERAESLSAPVERRLYQFGEFRADPVRRLLLRDGEPVAVTAKAFSLLIALLERRGELVEKDELLRRVWPDTYVTEANLTQNISSLRKALGERAGDRRYIVTVPGSGYSFVAEVLEVPAEASGIFPILRLEDRAPAAAPLPVNPVTPYLHPSEKTPERSAPEPLGSPRTVHRPGLTARSFALLLALAILCLPLVRPAVRPAAESSAAKAAAPAPHRPAVAVLGFKDLSDNPQTGWLGVALSEMLSTELSAGGQARLISGENVMRVRQSLSIPYTESLRGTDLGRLRSILGADLVVVGSYLVLAGKDGPQVRIDLRVMELPEGTVAASLTEVGKESELFETVSEIGARLRQALGLGALSPGQARAAQALHPAVPEAARLTAEGLARWRAFDPVGARQLLERAVRIEPGSAVIHLYLSRAWADVGDDAQALEEARQAMQLARFLSREERLAIEAHYHMTGKQWEQAVEVYRSLWTFFPDETDYGLQLATALINGGRGTEALQVLAVLRQTPAGRDDPRIDLEEARGARRVANLVTQMRASTAAETKARRSGERLALARALIYQGNVLLQNGQPEPAAKRFREAERLGRAVGHPWTAGMALSNLGSSLQALGHLDEAETGHRQSLAIARQTGTSIGVAAQLYTLALLQRDRGELGESLRLLQEAHAAYLEIDDRMMQGWTLTAMATILLRQGDLLAARRSAEEAVAASREVGNRVDEARALDVLATVLSWQGEIASAHRMLEDSLQILLGIEHPALAATALSSSADVLVRLGDMDLARRRLDQAAAADRRASDKMASGLMLGSHARLALRTGDVKRARSLGEALLHLTRQTGARSFEGWAHHELGRAQRIAGDLPAARASFQSAQRASSETGDQARGAVTRLELARLELSEGRSGEAAGMAGAVAAWAGPRSFAWLEAQALAVQAEALLREGRKAEAAAAGERVRALIRVSKDRELVLLTTVSLARLEAADGEVDGALRDLREAIAEAEKIGLVTAALEARLALGEIEARSGRGDRGKRTLRELRRDAEARGFAELARRASAGG